MARALERAKAEADAILADASERADLVLARAEELVAAWLDEANAEVARVLEPVPDPSSVEAVKLEVEPPLPARRRLVARLFGRRHRR